MRDEETILYRYKNDKMSYAFTTVVPVRGDIIIIINPNSLRPYPVAARGFMAPGVKDLVPQDL